MLAKQNIWKYFKQKQLKEVNLNPPVFYWGVIFSPNVKTTIQLSDIIIYANLIKLWYYKNVLSTKNAQISTTALSEVQRMCISILLQNFAILRVFKNLCQSLAGNFLKEKEIDWKGKKNLRTTVCTKSALILAGKH